MKDKNALIFFGGLVSLQYIVKFLKTIIKEDRPIKSKTYGMPSTKSATLFYTLGYLIGTNNFKKNTIYLMILLALIGLLYKLYYKEHSLKQVVIGSIVGLIYSYLIIKISYHV